MMQIMKKGQNLEHNKRAVLLVDKAIAAKKMRTPTTLHVQLDKEELGKNAASFANLTDVVDDVGHRKSAQVAALEQEEAQIKEQLRDIKQITVEAEGEVDNHE